MPTVTRGRTLIRPHNHHRAFSFVNTIRFVRMSVTRVVALIVEERFVEVFDSVLAGHRSEVFGDLFLFDFHAGAREDDDRLKQAVNVCSDWGVCPNGTGGGGKVGCYLCRMSQRWDQWLGGRKR